MKYGSECWAMKKVDNRRMQAAEMKIKMMYGKKLRDGIPNGLLRDSSKRSGRYRESSERDQAEMAWAS